VRIYGYYHSPYCSIRKEFERYNKDFDVIRENLTNRVFIDEMVNDNCPGAITKPVDVFFNINLSESD